MSVEEITQQETLQQQRLALRGVAWHKQAGKWQAFFQLNGKQKHLGLYDSLNAALEAARAARNAATQQS